MSFGLCSGSDIACNQLRLRHRASGRRPRGTSGPSLFSACLCDLLAVSCMALRLAGSGSTLERLRTCIVWFYLCFGDFIYVILGGMT